MYPSLWLNWYWQCYNQYFPATDERMCCTSLPRQCMYIFNTSWLKKAVYGHSLIINPSLGMCQEIHPLGWIWKSIPRDESGNPSLGMNQKIHPHSTTNIGSVTRWPKKTVNCNCNCNCNCRQDFVHVSLLRHQNIKTRLSTTSKNDCVLPFFLFFMSVREMSQFTVSLDHPVVCQKWYASISSSMLEDAVEFYQ